jgi:glycerophosphoryl diester phosphodiesterase
VKKVEHLLYISEYKRFQSAPGARLTKRAFWLDRRYPIVNRWRDYAIDRGVDMVEVDVQIIGDGHYILMHDRSFTTATDARDVFPDGSPSSAPEDPFALLYSTTDFTIEDVARLRLRDPLGGDHPVPTLDAALDLAEGRLLMLLELKNWEVESLVRLLEQYDTANLLLWTQGDQRKLAETSAAAGIGVAVDLGGATATRRLDRALELHGPLLRLAGVRFSELTAELVSMLEERGVLVDVDTRFHEVLEPDGTVAPWVQTALDSGAAVVWTRAPDDLLRVLGR